MTDSPGGMPDFGALLKQAQAMKEQFEQARATAAEAEVEGHSGGGVVKVRVTGGMEFEATKNSALPFVVFTAARMTTWRPFTCVRP